MLGFFGSPLESRKSLSMGSVSGLLYQLWAPLHGMGLQSNKNTAVIGYIHNVYYIIYLYLLYYINIYIFIIYIIAPWSHLHKTVTIVAMRIHTNCWWLLSPQLLLHFLKLQSLVIHEELVGQYQLEVISFDETIYIF